MTVKIFTPDVDPVLIRREISSVRRIGVHDLAPTVHAWNAEEGWYEEDYVDGFALARRPWTDFLDTFHESVPSLVVRITLAFPLRKTSSLASAEELLRFVRGDGEGTLSDERLDTSRVATITGFVADVVGRLRTEGDRSIYLGWSHGDFSTRHMISAGREASPILIDWERAAYRSATFDLYDALFTRLQQRGRMPKGTDVPMQKAISQFRLLLERSASADHRRLAESLLNTQVYRWVYYLEKLHSMVRRRDVTELRLDRILPFVEAFSRYEASRPTVLP